MLYFYRLCSLVTEGVPQQMEDRRDTNFEPNGGGQPQGNLVQAEDQIKSRRSAKILDKSEDVLMKMAKL